MKMQNCGWPAWNCSAVDLVDGARALAEKLVHGDTRGPPDWSAPSDPTYACLSQKGTLQSPHRARPHKQPPKDAVIRVGHGRRTACNECELGLFGHPVFDDVGLVFGPLATGHAAKRT